MALRLNLGCGDRYAEGWMNVDWAGCPHRVDLVVDLREPLPWRARSVSHVYMGHLLEHLTREQGEVLLRRLRLSMVKDGTLMAVGPDMRQVRSMIADGTFDGRYHSLESIRDGDHRWPGTEHQWETTAFDVQTMLREAGWVQIYRHSVGQLSDFWPVADRTQAWQYAIGARRG